MKNVIVALLSLIILSSCGDNPTSPTNEFEPYELGSFLIASPTSADYIGVMDNQNKKTLSSISSDTVEIKSPQDYSFAIEKGEDIEEANVYRIKFSFVDSTQRDRSNHDYTGFYSPAGALYSVNSRISINDTKLEAKFGINVNCTTYNKITNYPYVYFKSDYGNSLKVYRIHVDSIIETINLFTSCQ